MMAIATHTLFENIETVCMREDQVTVLYGLIDDFHFLVFTRKNKSRSPGLGSVPVNHL